MIAPDKPISEGIRNDTLVALNILDTQPEERFDRLTRIAKKSFDVPIAVVSLVDNERQWFKSVDGLAVCETSREISFCGHAILQDDIFIVPDTNKDERFYDNPLVINDPKIRFYAGVPVRAINGQRLGTFCIIDNKPRVMSDSDIESLKDLASIAERELSIIHLATSDDLTKISNRRGFMMLAKNNLKFCKRYSIPACLIYFDINDFKSINDRCGHSTGDKVLIAFSNSLKESFRDSDILSRLGGDEFVALLCDTSSIDINNMIGRLQEKLSIRTIKESINFAISFSYGVVEYNHRQHKTVKSLIDMGDSKMYRHKNYSDYENSITFDAI